MQSQVLTNGLPDAVTSDSAQQRPDSPPAAGEAPAQIPDDPSQQILPVAKPEPIPQTGVPVRWEALHQSRVGDEWRLDGEVVLYYKNYIVHADKVVYHQESATVNAEGHLQLEGGPSDAILTASHGEMHLEDHTATFYDVTGSFGVRDWARPRFTRPGPFYLHRPDAAPDRRTGLPHRRRFHDLMPSAQARLGVGFAFD